MGWILIYLIWWVLYILPWGHVICAKKILNKREEEKIWMRFGPCGERLIGQDHFSGVALALQDIRSMLWYLILLLTSRALLLGAICRFYSHLYIMLPYMKVRLHQFKKMWSDYRGIKQGWWCNIRPGDKISSENLGIE